MDTNFSQAVGVALTDQSLAQIADVRIYNQSWLKKYKHIELHKAIVLYTWPHHAPYLRFYVRARLPNMPVSETGY